MIKKKSFPCIAICLLFILLPVFIQAQEKDANEFEIPISELKSISVNHAKGSISFHIQDIQYFYYIQTDEDDDNCELISASSAILKDIMSASTIQIQSIPYGLHRKVTNLLLFYGDRQIPDSLQLKLSQPAPK